MLADLGVKYWACWVDGIGMVALAVSAGIGWCWVFASAR